MNNTRLKRIREEEGLTQEQLADISKVTVRTYRRVENGESEPSCKVIIALQNFFGKPIDYLLEQADDNSAL